VALAIAIVLVLEGALWALMPEAMKRAAAMAAELPASQLRSFGLGAACFGVALAWLLRG